MTTAYDQFAASAPVGVIELRCLELSHSLFAAPLRLVHDFSDWTVTLEDGVTVVTFPAGQFRTTPPAIDDQGRISRGLQIDAVDGSVFAQLQVVAASNEPVVCTFRIYLSSDLTGPQRNPPERTVLRGITMDQSKITATAQSADIINRKFPRRIYTTDNTPGLRR